MSPAQKAASRLSWSRALPRPLIGVVAIVVWIVQWANDYRHTHTARDILDERFARGEIDRAEYDEKRKLIGGR